MAPKDREFVLRFDLDPDAFDTERPESLPSYTVPDAAAYLGMHKDTLRSWFFGTTYGRKKTGIRQFAAVLKPADKKSRLLSFENLGEAYVLRLLRTKHLVNLQTVRSALKHLSKEFESERPLIHEDLWVHGTDLFVKKMGKLMSVGPTTKGQFLLPNFENFIDRLEWRDSVLSQLFPVGKLQPSSTPKIVAINPSISFGRPMVERTSVPIASLFDRYLAGESFAELIYDFDCTQEEVEWAIRSEVVFRRAA